MAIISDQAAAIEQQAVALGLAVVSDQAVAVGVTAVPTPVTDMASPLWFVHQLLFGEESALTDRTKPQTRISIDSKAMRKVEVGQDMVIVLENGGIGSGSITRIGGRILVKNN